MTRKENIKDLENNGELDPSCKTCLEIFYPFYKDWWDENIYNLPWPFAPRHKPSYKCESGKRPHCTCDVCF